MRLFAVNFALVALLLCCGQHLWVDGLRRSTADAGDWSRLALGRERVVMLLIPEEASLLCFDWVGDWTGRFDAGGSLLCRRLCMGWGLMDLSVLFAGDNSVSYRLAGFRTFQQGGQR